MSIQQVCVVYVFREGAAGPEVLLGRKLTGLGAGKVVAPGGKLEPGEEAIDAVQREMREEVGAAFRARGLREVGINRYRFPTRPNWHQDSHVFTACWAGGVAEQSTEINPFWCRIDAVPFEEMWADARHWLPSVLRGQACDGDYTFARDLTSLESQLTRGARSS